MRILILNLLILVTFSNCDSSTSLSASEKLAISSAVRQTLNNYYNDVKQSGLTAEFKYLDSSSDFFWAPPGYSSAISYDSVARLLRQNAPNFQSITNTFDTLSVIPLSKELATYTGRLQSTMVDTAGKSTTTTLVETGVLIKRTDGWKLLSGQTTVVNK